ncbi:MAG: glycosyltransferase family 2 protein [Zoogloeaceae bacterium]|jgi:glycosyltransferase involved in cell wall biosynthesis|nr:glycosyltransferase family 2 protein [Zoogloeaceae bacterium]
MRLVALIPVFNHGERVGMVVDALRALDLPVILVDDGSNDATARVLTALAAKTAEITLLQHAENRGKGAAVSTGIEYAARQLQASHVLQIDADAQHDLAALPDFLQAAARQPEAAIVACPRYDESVPRGRLYGRYLTHVWVWINTLSLHIVDSMCGLRVYPLAAVLPLLPALARARRMSFDVEILVRLDWADTPIVNLPVWVRYPENSRSHFRPWHDNLCISRMHARLFFGMLRRMPHLLCRRWRK